MSIPNEIENKITKKKFKIIKTLNKLRGIKNENKRIWLHRRTG